MPERLNEDTWRIVVIALQDGVGPWDLLHHSAVSLRRLRVASGSIPDEVTGFFNLPIPFSRNMTLGSTVSNRNEYQESSWGKRCPAHKADNLTVIREPIV
jgi:hypothetical protein